MSDSSKLYGGRAQAWSDRGTPATLFFKMAGVEGFVRAGRSILDPTIQRVPFDLFMR